MFIYYPVQVLNKEPSVDKTLYSVAKMSFDHWAQYYVMVFLLEGLNPSQTILTLLKEKQTVNHCSVGGILKYIWLRDRCRYDLIEIDSHKDKIQKDYKEI